METSTQQNSQARPPFSVVIPTYNGKHLLEKHLPAVLTNMNSQDELLIIDDASSDDTEDWFRDWKQAITKQTITGKNSTSPTIRYIQNITNLRFAATVNKAVHQVEHEYFVLLNNDVAPSKNLFSTLWQFAMSQSNPDTIFAIGCKEIEGDDESKMSGRNMLWFERGMFIHCRHPDMSSGETAWASGGSALFSTQKWLEIGGFDRQFQPAYWEDIDLSIRAKNHGWQVLFCENALVHHHHETTNVTVFGQQKITMMSWKNAYLFAWKHMNRSQWISHILWLPYHFFVSGSRANWIPPRAFFLALLQSLSHLNN